jgi:glyoxylase-like metal-dependent hydrolase (beta-lactamase superfamily II)
MKINFNNFELETVLFGTFRLDGGAMFGSVPKNLWNKRIKADDENCIPLAARCLLIKMDNRKILVDVGLSDKWNEKQVAIYNIKNTPLDELRFKAEEITDVILTHLHFDHGGGITKINNGKLELTYPNATIHIQKENFLNAQNPSSREKGSYFKENVEPLKNAKLNLLNGACEIMPNISCGLANGHTRGLQWIKVSDSNQTVVYPSDLIPTAHHIPLPYIMGYDICAETVLKEKEDFLNNALQNNWQIIFEHDCDTEAGFVAKDEKGSWMLR